METKEIKLSAIKPNPANPRVMRDYKFHKLVKSLLVLPQMLALRPIVVNQDNVVLGGNMRLKALSHILSLTEADRLSIMRSSNDYNKKSEEEKVRICEFWHKFSQSKAISVCVADSMNDNEQREFVIKDNSAFGDWDFDELANQYDATELQDYGIDMPDYGDNDEAAYDAIDEKKEFIVEVSCKDGIEQNAIFDKLKADGLKVKMK